MMKNYQKIIEYALRLLSRRRYTNAKLEEKLIKFAKKFNLIDEDSIQKCIKRLEELNYLDDYNYAKDFISERIKFKPRGKFLLNQELIKKGISKSLRLQAINDLDINEEDLAKKLLLKFESKWEKYGFYQKKNKAFSYLSSKGFSVDTIYKVIDSLYNNKEDKGLKN